MLLFSQILAIIKLRFDKSIKHKELSKCCLPYSLNLLSFINYSTISVKENQLLVRKVNLQPNNSQIFSMYRKPKQLLASFIGREVVAILVLVNLINSIRVDRDLYYSFIKTLIDILIEIFNSLYRTIQFDINISLISL